MKRISRKIFQKLFSLLFGLYCSLSLLMAQSSIGIDQATTEINSYVDPVSNLIIAIGAVVGAHRRSTGVHQMAKRRSGYSKSHHGMVWRLFVFNSCRSCHQGIFFLMESYHIQKTDTSLYVKGFSGKLVYLALYSIIGTFILFVLLYILVGVFTAIVICCPCFFTFPLPAQQDSKEIRTQWMEQKKTCRETPSIYHSQNKNLSKLNHETNMNFNILKYSQKE